MLIYMYVGVCWCEKISMLLIIMILYLLYCFVVPRWICLWFILVYICLHFSGNRPSGILAFNMNSPFVGKQARKPVTISLQTAVWINQDNDFLPHLILKITFTCCTFEKKSPVTQSEGADMFLESYLFSFLLYMSETWSIILMFWPVQTSIWPGCL